MRMLAFTTPEEPRFSWLGSSQVMGAGAAWGLVTGPILMLLRPMRWRRGIEGPAFGLIVLALACPPFLVLSGFRGSIVAPASFLWLSSVAFPGLFALHGVLVRRLSSRWPSRT